MKIALIVIGIITLASVGLAAVGFIKVGQAWREIDGVDERGYK